MVIFLFWFWFPLLVFTRHPPPVKKSCRLNILIINFCYIRVPCPQNRIDRVAPYRELRLKYPKWNDIVLRERYLNQLYNFWWCLGAFDATKSQKSRKNEFSSEQAAILYNSCQVTKLRRGLQSQQCAPVRLHKEVMWHNLFFMEIIKSQIIVI